MLKALIVDDEISGAKALQILLNKYCPEVTVLGIAHSINEAEKKINETSPDIVFLDIAMPMGTGFDLLQRLKKIDFEVVFTTAYNNYAIKAIKHNALDYLLKPVRKDELITAVKKCEERRSKSNSDIHRLEKIMDSIASALKKKKLTVSTQEGVLYIDMDDVIRFEGDSNYTHIHLLEGRKIMSSKNLGEYEDMVKGEHFFRIHKTHLVNLNYIKMYSKGDGGHIVTTDGASLEVYKLKKAELLQLLASKV
jgi:two-component system LytT family response regulator